MGRSHRQLAGCNEMVSSNATMEWAAEPHRGMRGVVGGALVLSTLINKQAMSAAGSSFTLDKTSNDNWMIMW